MYSLVLKIKSTLTTQQE